jgi:hypothetical protein
MQIALHLKSLRERASVKRKGQRKNILNNICIRNKNTYLCIPLDKGMVYGLREK